MGMSHLGPKRDISNHFIGFLLIEKLFDLPTLDCIRNNSGDCRVLSLGQIESFPETLVAHGFIPPPTLTPTDNRNLRTQLQRKIPLGEFAINIQPQRQIKMLPIVPGPSGEEERRELVVLPLVESAVDHAAADAEVRPGDGFQAGRGSAVGFHRMGVEGEEQGEFVGRDGALGGDRLGAAGFVAVLQGVGVAEMDAHCGYAF